MGGEPAAPTLARRAAYLSRQRQRWPASTILLIASFAMKNILALAATLALTTGPALAQGGGNSATGVTPNYKPGGGRPASNKPNDKNQIVRSGGQGHNPTHEPKGKSVVAPTTPAAHPGKRTPSTNPQPNAN